MDGWWASAAARSCLVVRLDSHRDEAEPPAIILLLLPALDRAPISFSLFCSFLFSAYSFYRWSVCHHVFSFGHYGVSDFPCHAFILLLTVTPFSRVSALTQLLVYALVFISVSSWYSWLITLLSSYLLSIFFFFRFVMHFILSC